MHKLKNIILTLWVFILTFITLHGQMNYWQQKIEYTINVELDVQNNQLHGFEMINYTNNSSDTLNVIYFNLYFNAFQPNSSMDIRSKTIKDPDKRVLDRISKLNPQEIGEVLVSQVFQNGKMCTKLKTMGTILEISLVEPILPGQQSKISLNFNSKIPNQIRRTGRYNKENIAFSMSQWYPKLCEYDADGWALNPYVGREFYGVWGDFHIKISLPDSFKIASTGIILNKNNFTKELTNTYTNKKGKQTTSKALANWAEYYIDAQNVHDFVWAADPHYQIDDFVASDDLILQFVYKNNMKSKANWVKLQPIMAEAINHASKLFGKYPYSKFSFIQGGDGGMEYPMATLVMGDQTMQGLISVCVHEMMHSWFQGVLGFNESLFAWMDEGFTSYAETKIKEHLKSKGMYPGAPEEYPFLGDVEFIEKYAQLAIAEPLTIHADHFKTNQAYSINSYVKGEIYLVQLGYIIGEVALAKTLLDFFQIWKFKHPTNRDFIRIAEKNTGINLDWFDQYMRFYNEIPDYGITSVENDNGSTKIIFTRKNVFPMPLDFELSLKNGQKIRYTIPLNIMYHYKKDDLGYPFLSTFAWDWVNPTYEYKIEVGIDQVKQIKIDPSRRLLDADLSDNVWPKYSN